MKTIISILLLATSVFASDLYKTTLKGKTYDAAIVVYNYYGSAVNLQDVDSGIFLRTSTPLCYNGDVNTAYKVLSLQMSKLWISDEEEFESDGVYQETIYIGIFDEFTYTDQDASEDERDDFITYVEIPNCNMMGEN